MRPLAKATLQIHVCVLLWGFTSVLGRLIALPALPLVWWRMAIAVSVLGLVPSVRRQLLSTSRRLLAAYAGIGVVVTLHWLTFYAAIKLANASVGAGCLALAPAFLAIIEPATTRRRFDPRELLLGVAVVPGVALLVGGIPHRMHSGVMMGVLSALLAALFNALNKRVVHGAHPLAITCIELAPGVLLLPCLAALLPHGPGPLLPVPSTRDALLLAVLAIACTLVPFVLALTALRHLTAYAVQLAVNLEPVYSIVLAVLILGEQRELDGSFYAGVAIILSAVIGEKAWLTRSPT
jgi:drug/metabolite transporter (DMT)-like permease